MSLEEKVIDEFYKYRTDYGGYTVYFENDKKLCKKEIRKIFSKYGPVRKIAQSDVYLCSHCFVTFLEEADVRKCIQDMNTYGDIQLLAITRGRQRPAYLSTRNRGTENEANQNSSCTRKDKSAKVLMPIQPKAATAAIKSRISADRISECEEAFERLALEVIDDIHYTELSKYGAPPEIPSASREEIIHEIRGCLEKFPNIVQKISIVTAKHAQEKSFYVPLKSRIPWKILRSVVVKEVTAHPVILANANGIYSADMLMDVLEKYQPLFVTHMEVTAKNSARYCCAYFKEANNADKVEAEFDGKMLWGSKLIVRKVAKLL